MVMPAASVAALVARGILDDPWAGGRERLDLDPVVLSGAEVEALACTACTVLMALDELVPAVAARADLLAAVGLDASLRAITALDAPRWLGLARVDVFATGDALPQACEVNCDTPTGLAETTELGRLGAVEHPHLRDPSARLGERWTAMVRDAAPDGDPRPVVGILDPTEMTEDLGHLRLISGWLGAAGCRVVRGSPFNLHAMPGGRVGLFGQPCTVLVRHYKADWWGGRQPIWSDVPPPPDAAPLSRGLDLIATAMAAGTVAVVNPWGAAIGQSKRTLALPWECPELLAAPLRAELAARLPETRWLEGLDHDRLRRERAEWVLKSDFGCEGEEVVMGSVAGAEEWAACLRHAAPGRWIAQRAFVPRRDAGGEIRNHGVFTIGGRPSGIYTRRSPGATDATARACPTLMGA